MWDSLLLACVSFMAGTFLGVHIFKRDYLAGIMLGEKWGEDRFKMSFAGPVYCGNCSNKLEDGIPIRCTEKEQ